MGSHRIIKPHRVTLKDVAKASGLSLSTVSNALAGHPSVRKATREKTIEVANDMGYRISSLARGLRTGKTGTIGFLVSDITVPYYPQVVRGIEDILLPHGYFLWIGNSDYDATKEQNYINHFLDRQVEGIFLSPYSIYSENVRHVREAGIPLVLLNRKHDSLSNDLVGVDYQGDTLVGLHYLWDLGHRKIGVLLATMDSSITRDRLAAIAAFLRQKNVSESTIVTQTFGHYTTAESGRDATRKLLANHSDVTAIFGADNVAVGALSALLEMGLNVPRDISVLGFDGLAPFDLPQISLSTMSVSQRELGRVAAELMLERISAPSDVIKTFMLRSTLVVRGTTAPPHLQTLAS